MSSESALFQKFGKELCKGTIVFHEGEPGAEMFVIQSGAVLISKTVREAQKLLATLGPGEFFGEMAIISNKERTATATVTEDARLLIIDSKTFEGMIRGSSEIAVRMIKKLAERLHDASEQIEDLLLADPHSRIVQYLLRRCQRDGLPTDEGIQIDVGLRDVSRALAVSDHSMRSCLARLVEKDLMLVVGERVTVFDTARLFEYLRYLEMRWKFGDF
jgi:CRP-like cAMP-binding protein